MRIASVIGIIACGLMTPTFQLDPVIHVPHHAIRSPTVTINSSPQLYHPSIRIPYIAQQPTNIPTTTAVYRPLPLFLLTNAAAAVPPTTAIPSVIQYASL